MNHSLRIRVSRLAEVGYVGRCSCGRYLTASTKRADVEHCFEDHLREVSK